MKIDDIDVNKTLHSKGESYGSKNSLKYFIAYNDVDVIRPLCIKLLQMIGYVRSFESNMTMSFKISEKLPQMVGYVRSFESNMKISFKISDKQFLKK